jgi:hypothetical protein
MKQKTNDLFNVLVYGKNLGVKRLIKSVCAQRNIPLIDTKNKTDLIAYDYKIAFIGRELLNDDLIETMNEISEFENPGSWDVIILGGKPENIPAPLRLFCKGLNNIDEVAISKIIDKHMPKHGLQVSRKTKDDIFKKRIYRIVYLYHLINESGMLYKDQLCKQFGITERTLFRDLKVLRELFPAQRFYFEKYAI